MIERVYTALFPFGGLGGGALGFRDAAMRLFGTHARFEVLGGIDSDPAACKDFTMLTGAPSLCALIETLEPTDLRRAFGDRAPDVVFMSPPCVGSSALLSDAKARTPKYRALNGLSLTWTRLMLRAWDEPPRIVLLENVPRIKSRARDMLGKLRGMLRRAGYVLHDGFHDCGELGGLAQHRRRFLLVARHARRVPPLLYQPPKMRVRACGEVLGALPLPGGDGGPMHSLPNISWLNWVRLALIPAGGDWRDLPGVLAEDESRRAKFKRHAVEPWTEPVGTIGGPGSNGVENVADPRLALACANAARVHHNKYRVEDWNTAAHTVTGATRPGSGAPAVADPRWFRGTLGVAAWDKPSGVVTGNARASTGTFSVADPRPIAPRKAAFDKAYGVLEWSEPSHTIAAGSDVGQGAYSVADVRVECTPRAGAYGVLSWEDAAKTITAHAKIDGGAFAIADPRRPPTFTPLIVAADRTWHRPLTTLELAALQDLPPTVEGKPLVLAGTSHSHWRRRIGNAVPRRAARAVAERMLVTLLQSDTEAFSLSSGGAVWVDRALEEARS